MLVRMSTGQTVSFPDGLPPEELKRQVGAVEAKLQGTPPAAQPEEAEKFEGFWEGAKRGITREPLLAMGARAGLSAAGVDAKSKEQDPEGIAANLGYYGAGLAGDAATLAAVTLATGGAGTTPTLAAMLGKEGLKQAAKAGGKQLAKAAAKSSAKGAAGMGAYMGARYPLEQASVEGREYSADEHAKQIAIGAASGAVLAPLTEAVIGLGGRAASKLWAKTRKELNIPSAEAEAIFARAEADAIRSRAMAGKGGVGYGMRSTAKAVKDAESLVEKQAPRLIEAENAGIMKEEMAMLQKALNKAGKTEADLYTPQYEGAPTLMDKIGEDLRWITRLKQEGTYEAKSVEKFVDDLIAGVEPRMPKAITGKVSAATLKAKHSAKMKPGQVDAIRARTVAQEYEKLGYDTKKMAGKKSAAADFGSQTQYLQSIQDETGVPLGDLAVKGYRNHIKRSHQIGELMEESLALKEATTKFNVAPGRAFQLAEGAAPATPEEEAFLALHRKFFDRARAVAREYGEDIGYREDYMPRRMIANIKGVSPPRSKVAAPGAATMAQKRSVKGISEAYQKKDYFELVTQYMKEVDQITVKPVIKEYLEKAAQLKTLGFDKYSQDVVDSVVHATGYAKPAAKNLIGSTIIKESKLDIAKVMEVLEASGRLGEDKFSLFMDKLNEAVYGAWVGLNPRVHMQQRLQNIVLGVPELGRDAVKYGTKAYKNLKPIEKELLAKKVAPYGGQDLRELSAKLTDQPTEGKLSKGILWAGRQGLKVFNKTDISNRGRIYLGAAKKFDDFVAKGEIEPLLEGLHMAEKDTIRKAFREGGAAAAREEYALTMVDRVHFRYSPFETPKVLRGGLGRVVPFTSWTRNNWERYIQDVKQGDVRQLARRIALPLIYSYMIQVSTGIEIPGLHTIGGLTGIGGIRPIPAVQGPMEKLQRGQYGRAATSALEVLPPVRIASILEKAVKKGPVAAAGLRKSKVPSIAGALEKRVEDLLKKR